MTCAKLRQWTSLLVLGLSASCAGSIELENGDKQGPGHADQPTQPVPSASPTNPGEAVVEMGPDGPSGCNALVPGHAPLRRLTNEEYANSVRDLLDVEPSASKTFVEDERVGGFASNLTSPISETSVEQYGLSAEAIGYSIELEGILPCTATTESCARAAVESLILRLFRRPAVEGEVDAYYTLFASIDAGFDEAMRWLIVALLQSPHFLYHTVDLEPAKDGIASLTPYAIASRLSFLLWRSAPDTALLEAAKSGSLATQAGINAEVDRMLQSDKALPVIASFHSDWLGLFELAHIEREGLGEYTKDAMQHEFEAFVSHIVTERSGTLAELLTSPVTFATNDTAVLWGLESGDGSAQQANAEQRSGLLTHPGVLTAHSSPVHRGKLVRELLLCQAVAAPPADVNTDLPPKETGISERERWEQHVQDERCAGCHSQLDPIGFGFDHYSPVGAYRNQDAEGFAIDASGEVIGTTDANGTFYGAPELTQRLSQSDDVMQCVARQWTRYALGRLLGANDSCLLSDAVKGFADANFEVRALLRAIATSPAFVHVEVAS